MSSLPHLPEASGGNQAPRTQESHHQGHSSGSRRGSATSLTYRDQYSSRSDSSGSERRLYNGKSPDRKRRPSTSINETSTEEAEFEAHRPKSSSGSAKKKMKTRGPFSPERERGTKNTPKLLGMSRKAKQGTSQKNEGGVSDRSSKLPSLSGGRSSSNQTVEEPVKKIQNQNRWPLSAQEESRQRSISYNEQSNSAIGNKNPENIGRGRRLSSDQLFSSPKLPTKRVPRNPKSIHSSQKTGKHSVGREMADLRVNSPGSTETENESKSYFTPNSATKDESVKTSQLESVRSNLFSHKKFEDKDDATSDNTSQSTEPDADMGEGARGKVRGARTASDGSVDSALLYCQNLGDKLNSPNGETVTAETQSRRHDQPTETGMNRRPEKNQKSSNSTSRRANDRTLSEDNQDTEHGRSRYRTGGRTLHDGRKSSSHSAATGNPSYQRNNVLPPAVYNTNNGKESSGIQEHQGQSFPTQKSRAEASAAFELSGNSALEEQESSDMEHTGTLSSTLLSDLRRKEQEASFDNSQQYNDDDVLAQSLLSQSLASTGSQKNDRNMPCLDISGGYAGNSSSSSFGNGLSLAIGSSDQQPSKASFKKHRPPALDLSVDLDNASPSRTALDDNYCLSAAISSDDKNDETALTVKKSEHSAQRSSTNSNSDVHEKNSSHHSNNSQEQDWEMGANGTIKLEGFGNIYQTGLALPEELLSRLNELNLHSDPSHGQKKRRSSLTKEEAHAVAQATRVNRGANIQDELVFLDFLGSGASGSVRRALHVPTLQLVAVKQVRIYDPYKRAEMAQELKTLYANMVPLRAPTLQSSDKQYSGESPSNEIFSKQNIAPAPYIVKFFDAFSMPSSGQVAIVMEYMGGGSWQDLVDAGGVQDESRLSSMSGQILQGIAYLHRRRQIHRDIKPGNMLISHDGSTHKLADFGIAKQLDESEQAAKTWVGTMIYMSPERIDSDSSYGYPSDVWAFGLTILTVAVGKFPYDDTNFWEVSRAIKNDPPPISALDEVCVEGGRFPFSDDFKDFLSECLRKDPSERWSAEKLLDHPFIQKRSKPTAARNNGLGSTLMLNGEDNLSPIAETAVTGTPQSQKEAKHTIRKIISNVLDRHWTNFLRYFRRLSRGMVRLFISYRLMVVK